MKKLERSYDSFVQLEVAFFQEALCVVNLFLSPLALARTLPLAFRRPLYLFDTLPFASVNPSMLTITPFSSPSGPSS